MKLFYRPWVIVVWLGWSLVAAGADPAAGDRGGAGTNATSHTGAKVVALPSSEPARRLFLEGNEAFARNDRKTAAARYRQVLELEPNNVTALSNLGVTCFHLGQLDEAEKILEKAVRLSPNNSPAHTILGVVSLNRNRLTDAFAELTWAVSLDSANAEAHNYLGIVLSEKGEGAEAEQEMRKAIEINPRYTDAHFNLAVLYARQKPARNELARYHYRKALDLGAPPDPQLESTLKSAAPAAGK